MTPREVLLGSLLRLLLLLGRLLLLLRGLLLPLCRLLLLLLRGLLLLLGGLLLLLLCRLLCGLLLLLASCQERYAGYSQGYELLHLSYLLSKGFQGYYKGLVWRLSNS